MNEGNSDIDLNDRPVFTAELKPYRSLGHRGHVVLFLIAGAMTFAHMAVFLISGAWPVVMFFGLDFLVLIGACWLNNRSARARVLIALSRTNISIRKVTPSGRQTVPMETALSFFLRPYQRFTRPREKNTAENMEVRMPMQ